MEVEYDPAKRAATLAKRGLDMPQAGEIFEGPHLTSEDERKDYGERRFVTMGHIGGRLMFVAWTWRGRARRIISLRKANGREEKDYRFRPGERF